MGDSKKHPILFSGPMVRAILDGRKTQTRRVVSDHNSQGNFRASQLLLDDPRTFVDPGPSPAGNPGPYLKAHLDCLQVVFDRPTWKPGGCDESVVERLYPRYFPGDRLWVRETWAIHECYDRLPPRDIKLGSADHIFYEEGFSPGMAGFLGRWRPSIHMPRWASRLLLDVVDVRAERLQEITEEDARAEGVDWGVAQDVEPDEDLSVVGYPLPGDFSASANFRMLWDSLNAKRGYPWESNPWVWVIKFQRVEP